MKEENILYNISENGARILVYKMTETVEALIEELMLTQWERLHFDRISTEKRKLEFLGVRLCFMALFGKSVEVRNDNHGKPYLIDLSAEISVSHSKSWIAIIAHPAKQVGIDIECRTDKIQKIYKRFLSELEQAELADSEFNGKFELAWSAKEALYKIIGSEAVDFSTQLRILPFEIAKKGTMNAKHIPTKQLFQLSYVQTRDYSLVYCVS